MATTPYKDPAKTVLWDTLVEQYAPGYKEQYTNAPAYEFNGGRIVFFNKKNPYNEAEKMRGSQGGLNPDNDGWSIK